jgi:hypothetical protein
MLALVVVVEGAFQHHWLDWSGHVLLNCRYAAQMARTEAARSELLCLGDSQMKTGIDPTILERELGLRAFNLAVLGCPTPLSYYLLRRTLEAGAHPRAILLGHMTMGGGPQDAHHFEALVGPAEYLDLTWQARDADYAAALLLTRLFPSLRHREAIRSQVAGRSRPERARMVAIWNGWREAKGSYRMPPRAGYHGEIEPELARTLYAKPWYISAVYATYFDRLLDLAAARSIPVFFLVSPIVPEAQSRRIAQGFDVLHTRNLHALQVRHPNLIVIDARRPDWPASEFLDSLHLNEFGSRHLSAEVAAVLRRQLDARSERPGWISLRDEASGQQPATLAGAKSAPPAR